jgi:putative ABC transport system permease protein
VNRRVPIAWLQLKREKLRLLAAIAGVAFGVVLIFVQLGFQRALFDSSVRFHSTLDYEIAIISPKTDTIVRSKPFPRSRLYQLAGVEGVEAVTPVYLASASWRNPVRPADSRTIFVFGFDPTDTGFAWPGVSDGLTSIRLPDRVLFDRASRTEFGPIVELFEKEGLVETEVNDRRIEVTGLFELGTSFGIDGSLVTSDLNFHRLFPDREASHVDIGLVHLQPGADAGAVRQAILAAVPGDVDVLTRNDFVEREIAYWNGSTPIGFVFSFGVVMGLVVGLIIVYQILFSDVQDSLSEYATLKAMGYTHGFLVGVVMREAILLAVLGYVPAVAMTLLVYREAGAATNLAIEMTMLRAVFVFGLTAFMCCASAALAIRKLKSAEPAEIF